MRRKTLLVILTLFVLFAGSAQAASLFRIGSDDKDDDGKPATGSSGKYFPESGDVEDLVRTSKVLTYKNKKFQELYGEAGNRYIQFGMLNMMSADYTLGGSEGRISLEIAAMETPTAAAGLFHHHRGVVLRNLGEAVDVGAEGVLDVPRGRRNLYFYRGRFFVKIVYSGKAPVPSLLDIAESIDAKLPSGRDAKPTGFRYIAIEGVNKDSASLTPGFTFNLNFLPASVTASAPGGGSPASDIYLITKIKNSEAAELYKDYNGYLKLHAEYIEEYRRGKQRYTKAVDPNHGRVLFTAYKNVFIIAARPDGYDKGEVLIDRIIDRIDGGDGGADAGEDDEDFDERDENDGGGKQKRGIWPFRRRQ